MPRRPSHGTSSRDSAFRRGRSVKRIVSSVRRIVSSQWAIRGFVLSSGEGLFHFRYEPYKESQIGGEDMQRRSCVSDRLSRAPDAAPALVREQPTDTQP